VRLGCGPGKIQFVVSDNGPGISAADSKAIFEKFHQVEDVSLGKPRGTGLGLSISRRIASHFGGRMWVESEPGHGSSFFFTLPLREEVSADSKKLQEKASS
jgi:signal transduction histidine kinase